MKLERMKPKGTNMFRIVRNLLVHIDVVVFTQNIMRLFEKRGKLFSATFVFSFSFKNKKRIDKFLFW